MNLQSSDDEADEQANCSSLPSSFQFCLLCTCTGPSILVSRAILTACLAPAADGPFLSSLGAALHPQHGVVCVNVHSGEQPSSWKKLALWLAGSQWLDPFVTPIAQVYRHV